MRAIHRPELPFPELDHETKSLTSGYEGQEPYPTTWRKDRWRRPRVVGALYAMHGESCAYCQGLLTRTSDSGDAEHFRPKSVYWWLAYDFSNYLLSCMACNRYVKKEEFPLAPGEPGLRFGDGRNISEERKLLLDPSFDPVGRIGLTRAAGLWKLVANEVDGKPDPQAAETIRFFGLNHGLHPSARAKAIAKSLEVAKRIREGDGGRPEMLERASRFKPYGMFVRRVLEKGGFSDLLPSPRDEIRYLLADLRFELESLDTCLEEHPKPGKHKALRDRFLWALAVIWWSPLPPVSRGEVEDWIGDRYRPEARSCFDRIRADLRTD